MENIEKIRFIKIIDRFVRIISEKQFKLKEQVIDELETLKDLVSNQKLMPAQFTALITQVYGQIIDAMVSEKLIFHRDELHVWHDFSMYMRISDQQIQAILSNG